MRFSFKHGIVAAALVMLGSTSPHASNTLQSSDATGGKPSAMAAANPYPNPPPHAGEGTGGGPTIAVPPVRIGRISLIAGKLELRGPGEAKWSAASINDPVATGMSLHTDPQTRGEIRIGPDTIDLAEGTEITVIKLDPRTAEIAVREGRIELDIGALESGESVEIDTPHGGVWPLERGRYDIDIGGGDRPLRIAAFAGNARFAGNGADLPIASGYRLLLSDTGLMAAQIESASDDEFVKWCKGRAVDDAQLAAPYFMSREITGYAALDDAGNWQANDKYGEVWVPKALPAGWAPYRNGHWRWLSPWGWSWVDDQSWGFATTHYGRWIQADGQWLWSPGKLTANPVWAPAVVAFLGTRGVGLSYADGPGPAIAWFPLAPGEVYWPSYTRDLDYIRAINRGNVADLNVVRIAADGEPPAEISNGHFANRAFASAVPRPVFVSGEPIAAALLTIPDERLLDAPAIMGSPDIGPPPPAPVRVAGAATIREHPPAASVAVKPGQTAAWDSIVRAAEIRSRRFQETARLRFVHLRGLSSAENNRLRHTIVLRVARADHAGVISEMHKRMLRR